MSTPKTAIEITTIKVPNIVANIANKVKYLFIFLCWITNGKMIKKNNQLTNWKSQKKGYMPLTGISHPSGSMGNNLDKSMFFNSISVVIKKDDDHPRK